MKSETIVACLMGMFSLAWSYPRGVESIFSSFSESIDPGFCFGHPARMTGVGSETIVACLIGTLSLACS